jgi:hypothetical protein
MADKKDEGTSLTKEAAQKETDQENVRVAEDFLKSEGVFSTPKSSDKVSDDKPNDGKDNLSEDTK